ncbi:ABC transporter substrate-binding protein (plasmid) [Streptomyces sp. NBC_01362]|uniref:ABC transporter substrate-binding protein n=1 Tax=Streptomyces sp. NBC_01362 TaxID=2903839 RepID=UPI002E367CB9|nr:ABC transporter substrate-binding protein [Streptomyces sp. NBC_01362]
MSTRTTGPRPRLRLAIALLAVVLPVAACSDEGTDVGGKGDGAPRDGGTLLVGSEADPSCLDPQQTGQVGAVDISRSVVDGLTYQDPKTGRIVPWLAKSFTTSADGSAFTFVLRDGATFSDGKPVDAAAVKTTFDNLVKLPANGAPGYLIGYQGTTVTDAHRLTVKFDTANAQFLQATSTVGLGILSPATFTASAAERCRGKFIGSGPYVLDHYTTNQEAVLKKRKDYAWPSSLATNKGAAHFDEVKFSFIPEGGARTGALTSGQVQIAKALLPTDEVQFKGNGFRILSAPGPGLVPPLSLNHKGILADYKVRAALLKGIDRQGLVDSVFSSSYKPATSVLSSVTPYYKDFSDKLRYDAEGARALLDSAGWKPGKDGIRVKNGRPLALTWLIPAPMPPADEAVQQQLRKIGVDVKLKPVAPPVYVEQQQKGQFDLTAVGVTRADPDILRNIFHSKGDNLWHLPAGRLDTYLEQQVSATDEKSRQTAVTDAVEWILDHADTVPLYEGAQVHGVSDTVKGFGLDASNRFDLHDAWLG